MTLEARARILVVGAVLVDIVATSSGDDDLIADRIGSVEVSIGGAAFNVAANLSAKKFKCTLAGAIYQKSVLSGLLEEGIRMASIDKYHLFSSDGRGESAFVSLSSVGGEGVAITSSPIEYSNIFRDGILSRMILSSDLIAIDTNLSIGQIEEISAICGNFMKPLCVLSASDSKIARVVAGNFCSEFALVSMNNREAELCGARIDADNFQVNLPILRSLVRSNVVIVSDGSRGFYISDSSVGSKHFPPPDVVVRSALGAGDAIFSAACASMALGSNAISERGIDIIMAWVSEVLARKSGNLSRYLST